MFHLHREPKQNHKSSVSFSPFVVFRCSFQLLWKKKQNKKVPHWTHQPIHVWQSLLPGSWFHWILPSQPPRPLMNDDFPTSMNDILSWFPPPSLWSPTIGYLPTGPVLFRCNSMRLNSFVITVLKSPRTRWLTVDLDIFWIQISSSSSPPPPPPPYVSLFDGVCSVFHFSSLNI